MKKKINNESMKKIMKRRQIKGGVRKKVKRKNKNNFCFKNVNDRNLQERS